MQYKKGICTECKKKALMASKKFCIYCIQPKRTPLKPTNKPIKPKNRNAKRNQDYYKNMWESHQIKKCENCHKELPGFSPMFISHIIPKGSNSALRCEPENHNLLCTDCHHEWEFGNRKSMNIYPKNQLIIEKLTLKYYELGDRG